MKMSAIKEDGRYYKFLICAFASNLHRPTSTHLPPYYQFLYLIYSSSFRCMSAKKLDYQNKGEFLRLYEGIMNMTFLNNS